MAKYEDIFDGEPFIVEKRGTHIGCCDCGLVHSMKIENVTKKHAKITMRRLNKSTGAARKGLKTRKTSKGVWIFIPNK